MQPTKLLRNEPVSVLSFLFGQKGRRGLETQQKEEFVVEGAQLVVQH